MRLYFAEGDDRWRLAPGERIDVPAGIAAYAGEMGGSEDPAEGINPPRVWTERLFSDLRSWDRMPSGGHFAAFEEPEAYAAELTGFLDRVTPSGA